MWVNVNMGWCCLGVSGWVGGGYEELQSLQLIENYEPCVRRNVRQRVFFALFRREHHRRLAKTSYWQRSAGVRGKHKCAEMPNTNLQKCQTQMYRNVKYNYEEVQNIIGVQKWVVLTSYKQ